MRWRIHALDLEALSLMASESAATQLSVMFPRSTRTVCADESRLQLGRQFRWQFQRRDRLNFLRWFPRQPGLYALTNPRVSLGSTVVDFFSVGSYSAFGDNFRVNRTVCADESRLLLGRQSRWWLLRRQRLGFRLQFRSQQGLLR